VEVSGRWVVSPDGRLFLTDSQHGVRVFTPHDGSLQLDRTIPLPGFDNMPDTVLSPDGRRFVARDYTGSVVYAGDTTTGELFGPWD
jgi:hypothetical protein